MLTFLQSLLGGVLPDWLIYVISFVVNTTVILIVAPVTFMMMTWFERRIVARMQDRLGPNRVGPAGLLQAVADGVKMFTKENITPRAADQWVHLIAPVIATAPVIFLFAVIPWGRGLAPADIHVSVLFVIAISSISAVGLMMGGWGSNNKFALLGAMRAVAQMVSYEIPAVIALLAMVLFTGTMNLNQYSELQGGIPIVGNTLNAVIPDLGLGWYVFTPVGLLGFVAFFICILSEGERTPFDIPEADSEIVAGYMTEYSGMKFAVFYMGQFLFNYALSMVAAIVFLGGWNFPGIPQLANAVPILGNLASAIVLGAKAWLLFCVMVWLRGAFPRLRMDQLMGFAWKFLLPLVLINILSAAIWLTVRKWGSDPNWTITIAPFGLNLLGWLETAPAWLRELIGWVLSAIINGAAFVWLLRVNRRPAGETPVELAQDQAFGVASLP
jgi:NADH-quinone oxidoreductase subunit H